MKPLQGKGCLRPLGAGGAWTLQREHHPAHTRVQDPDLTLFQSTQLVFPLQQLQGMGQD